MLIYITTSAGVVLNVHYCMGKVSSVKIDNFSEETCKCGDRASEMSCCFSQFKVVKLEDAHKSAVITHHLQPPIAVLPSRLSIVDVLKTTIVVTDQAVAHGPPLNSSSQNIYLKNRVFRI